MNASRKVPDSEPWKPSTSAVSAFNAPGWQSGGDKVAWEKQLTERTQGQNDYARR
ncbi:MAG: hypothetical protein ABIW85_06200 [Variovorax sp.]